VASESQRRQLWTILGRPFATKEEATEAENALVESYTNVLLALILSYRAGQISEDEFLNQITVMVSEYSMAAYLSGMNGQIQDLDVYSWEFLQEQSSIHLESARNLATWAEGEEVTPDQVQNRVGLWAATMMSIFFAGMSSRPDDPYLMWVRNPLKDSCADCVRLDGQVHRASEWRARNWLPRARNLECRGYNCGCIFVETDGPSSGSF
jgi:hypothetical protein